MNINFYDYPKIVLLPIQEPWASMIANKEKQMELRSWIPKFPVGSLILVVATGKAKGPRCIIASAVYQGLHTPEELQAFAVNPKRNIALRKIGWNDQGEYGIGLKDIIKWNNPLPITFIAPIRRTPMKFQYIDPEYMEGKYEE